MSKCPQILWILLFTDTSSFRHPAAALFQRARLPDSLSPDHYKAPLSLAPESYFDFSWEKSSPFDLSHGNDLSTHMSQKRSLELYLLNLNAFTIAPVTLMASG